MYDFAHPIQDAIEGITHSLCSLEYEDHRPLYNWVVENAGLEGKPRQIEFARLNVTYTVMSKRYLRSLVEDGLVDGWDDPRMPTLCGLRRRGFTPGAILDFCDRIGVAKSNSMVDIELLEHCVREELNKTAQRRIAVLDPVKVTVTNYPEDKTEYFSVSNNPNDEEAGVRQVPFTRTLYVDREDVSTNPPPKYFRLKEGGEVRLMGAYIVKCDKIITDDDGRVTEVLVTADLQSGCGNPFDGRKIKGTIHWLSSSHSIKADVMLYDRLFTSPDMSSLPEGKTYNDYLNENSLKKLEGCLMEESLKDAKPGEKFQFVRTGYFCLDTKKENTFNRVVTLKDSYKVQ